MDWLKRMNSVLDYIESNLDGEIDDNKIAALSAIPKGMFQRVFAIITDMTLSEYIRKRRLTQAANDIKNTDVKIIDIAIKYGYTSANAFSAAFNKFHGVMPSRARTSEVQRQDFRPFAFTLTLSVKGGNKMHHRKIVNAEEFMQSMEEKILPEWASKINNGSLRIWSAACSSGEEPYSIAMLINDFFNNDIAGRETSITATDLSEESLDIAKQAVYSQEQLEKMNPEWIVKYFDALPDGNYVVKGFLKEVVHFAPMNLVNEFPFHEKFHIIFGRNLMGFFDKPNNEKLFQKFYNALENGGYLVVGADEALSDINTDFKFVSPSIYQKP